MPAETGPFNDVPQLSGSVVGYKIQPSTTPGPAT